MNYYFKKEVASSDFEEVIRQVTEALSNEGFGVLTEIDVQATMKKKLDKDMPPYRILGACHAPSAYKALQAEKMIGTMLPCNVIVRKTENETIEVAAVDPVASMSAVENDQLGDVATEVREKLRKIINQLS
jgi:uncharacterized protein (DUF302 family)